MEQYWTKGYVIKHGLLNPSSDLEPSRVALARLVDTIVNRLHAEGLITDLCKDFPFETRMIEIEKQFPNASVLLHKMGVLPKEIADLWSGETLIACARQFLGDDIAGHPVWNIRVKTPGQEQATVPWHQDTGYLDPVSIAIHQPTAWVPLVPAVRENGCMEVLDSGHRSGLECKHECCVGGTWYVQIADKELEKIGVDAEKDRVLCECPLGSVLFINNLIPHRSLSNVSEIIRWSLDLRWQSPTLTNGFWGLKESILMRKASDPAYKPDWSTWSMEDRQEAQLAAALANPSIAAEISKALDAGAPSETGMLVMAHAAKDASSASAAATATATAAPSSSSSAAKSETKEVESSKFDTVIAGPWMGRWGIVHHNKHVDRFLSSADGKTSWHSADAANF
jgi:hypothetical protein